MPVVYYHRRDLDWKPAVRTLTRSSRFFHIFRMCFSLCPPSALHLEDRQKDLWFGQSKPLATSPWTCTIILWYFRLLEREKWVKFSKKITPPCERPKKRNSYHLFMCCLFCGIQIYDMVSISLWGMELNYLCFLFRHIDCERKQQRSKIQWHLSRHNPYICQVE